MREWSPEEWSVWSDRDFMPMKVKVWAKLEEELIECLKMVELLPLPVDLPLEWFATKGRIYRGENYHSYSYRSLDFPKYVKGEDLLLLRVVLLWGHPAGIHLICSGTPRKRLLSTLTLRRKTLSAYWHLACHSTPWTWEPDAAGWVALPTLSDHEWKACHTQRDFVKVSRFLSLDSLSALGPFVQDAWQEMIGWLGG